MPIEDKSAVTVVPIFCHKMIVIAVANEIGVESDNACKIPTDADELWITAVSNVPTKTPKIGFSKRISVLWKASLSDKGSTAADIKSIPVIRIAKPIKTSAVFFLFSDFENIVNTTPIKAKIGAKVEGLIS